MQQKKHVGEYLLRILFFYEPKSTENIFYKIVEIKMFLYINKKTINSFDIFVFFWN